MIDEESPLTRSNGYVFNVAEATSFDKQPPRSSGTSGHSVADAIRERRIEDPERLLMRTDRNPGRSWAASPEAGHRRRRGSYSRSDRQPSACRGWRPRTGGVRRCSHSWDHCLFETTKTGRCSWNPPTLAKNPGGTNLTRNFDWGRSRMVERRPHPRHETSVKKSRRAEFDRRKVRRRRVVGPTGLQKSGL